VLTSSNKKDDPDPSIIRDLDKEFEVQRIEDIKHYLKQQSNSTVTDNETFFTPVAEPPVSAPPKLINKRSSSLTSQDTFSSFSSRLVNFGL